MKEKKIFDAITNVPDEMITEAHQTPLRHKAKRSRAWMKWVAGAACLAIGMAAIFAFQKLDDFSTNFSTEALAAVIQPQSASAYDWQAQQAQLAANPVDDSFMSAVDAFAYSSASQILSGATENANYSPLSLYFALSILATGADGTTADELFAVLGVSDSATLSSQCANLYRRLYTDNEASKLTIANSLWMEKNIPWNPTFAPNAAESFFAQSFIADFGTSETNQRISDWIAQNTNDTLQPTIETSIDTIMMIVNTIYFNDAWFYPFEDSFTQEDTFFLSTGEPISCDFMHNEIYSNSFWKGDGFTRANLSLENLGEMVFILPDENVSPQSLLADAAQMQNTFSSGEPKSGMVIWDLPKFQFTSKFDLIGTLQRLGIHEAFGNAANLAGITEMPAFVSKIEQGTYIAIDEKGVEASAFTEIGVECIDDVVDEAPPEQLFMRLDRPFIYGILTQDGTLLFIGICENPTLN